MERLFRETAEAFKKSTHVAPGCLNTVQVTESEMTCSGAQVYDRWVDWRGWQGLECTAAAGLLLD